MMMGNGKIHRCLSVFSLAPKIRMTLETDHINGKVTSSGQRSRFRSSPVSMLNLPYHHRDRSPYCHSLNSKSRLDYNPQLKPLISVAINQAPSHRSHLRILVLQIVGFRLQPHGELKLPMTYPQSSNRLPFPYRMDSLSPLLTSQSILQQSQPQVHIRHPTLRIVKTSMERGLSNKVVTHSIGTRVAHRQKPRKTRTRVALQLRLLEAIVSAKVAQPQTQRDCTGSIKISLYGLPVYHRQDPQPMALRLWVSEDHQIGSILGITRQKKLTMKNCTVDLDYEISRA